MALPASPPISLSQVCAEFGAPANTPLTAFLRGGAWVPNTPVNAGVPASLPISLLQLLGASAYTSLSAIASPPSVEGSRNTSGVLSGSVNIVASGGTGSYTYSSSWLNGPSGTITLTGTNTASPGVTATSPVPNALRTGVVRTVVTSGAESVNVDWAVTLEWNNE